MNKYSDNLDFSTSDMSQLKNNLSDTSYSSLVGGDNGLAQQPYQQQQYQTSSPSIPPPMTLLTLPPATDKDGCAITKSISPGMIPGPKNSPFKSEWLINDNPKLVAQAESNRSIGTSLIGSIVTLALKMGVSQPAGASDLADFIFIQSFLGNYLGFVFDQIWATKEGFATWRANKISDGNLGAGKMACLTQKVTDKCSPEYGNLIFNPHIVKDKKSSDDLGLKGRMILNPDVKRDMQIITADGFDDGKKKDDSTRLIVPLIEKDPTNNDKVTFRYNGDGWGALQNISGGGKPELALEPVGTTKYLLNYIGSVRFLRFIITVLLDTIISTPIYIKLKEFFEGMGIESAMFNSVLQGLVGITTFYLYTNATRLEWAYTQEPSDQMTIAVGILLVCGSLGMIAMEENPEGDIFDQLNGRMALILPGLLLLSAHKVFLSENKSYKRGILVLGVILSILIVVVSFIGVLTFKEEAKVETKDLATGDIPKVTSQSALEKQVSVWNVIDIHPDDITNLKLFCGYNSSGKKGHHYGIVVNGDRFSFYDERDNIISIPVDEFTSISDIIGQDIYILNNPRNPTQRSYPFQVSASGENLSLFGKELIISDDGLSAEYSA